MVMAIPMANEYPLGAYRILLLQADNFSDLQIEQFSKGTLVDLHKHIRNTCKISGECIETALDEDLGLKEAERIV
ncbi:hypothetical protein RCL_jg6861.t1 [Rhizophagus clarus]|uniref:Uncharacterized protein n=1 Tax=Rhizophagus clarus TaxID=94130 RepID=A0A8H3LE92_9GLOM|nr:hypothetical protein RCL_jg6861.t1 [Rhizophagus clarus]